MSREGMDTPTMAIYVRRKKIYSVKTFVRHFGQSRDGREGYKERKKRERERERERERDGGGNLTHHILGTVNTTR